MKIINFLKYSLMVIVISVCTILSIKTVKLIKEVNILKNQNKYIMTHLSGGVGNIPKARGALREKQLELLKVLMEFDRFAKEHNIKYWLDYGTALGAYRHKGYVPWDDDLDIAMTESNLKKLIELSKDKENGILMVPQKNNPDGPLWFMNNKYGGLDIYNHIVTDEEGLRSQEKYTYWLNAVRYIVWNARKMIFSHFNEVALNDEEINTENRYFITRFAKRNTGENIYTGTFKMEDIYPLKTIEFEGYQFPAPNNIEQYLEVRYGKNFRNLPNDFGYSHHLESWE